MNLNKDEIYWMNSVNYPDDFMVSSDGRMFSLRTGKELKRTIGKTGYWQIASRIGGRLGKCICMKIHREVALRYVPNPNNYPFVNHLDGDKLNPNWWNLEWCTPKMNSVHAAKNGLTHTGPVWKKRKLTPEQMEHVAMNPDKLSSRKLGKLFGIDHMQVLRYRKKYLLESRIR